MKKFSVNKENALKWHNSVWDFFYVDRTKEEIEAYFAAKLNKRTSQ